MAPALLSPACPLRFLPYCLALFVTVWYEFRQMLDTSYLRLTFMGPQLNTSYLRVP